MALLRNIERKYRHWRFNNKPYVEPNEEQKEIAYQRRLEARKSLQQLGMMLATIQGACPDVIARSYAHMRD